MRYSTSIGLDVHARSIAAAAFVPETGEIIQRRFEYDPASVIEWTRGLPAPVQLVYESGPTGFDLARKLIDAGLECKVGAVSKMLRPTGDRIKTDKRDAVFLARMLAVGNVVEVHVPTPSQEAARDLARAREDARKDLMRARHLLSKFLLRKGIAYEKGRSAWTKTHRKWLSSLSFDDPCERLVFDEYLAGVITMEQRRDRLDAAIGKLSATPGLAGVVNRLKCIRGISTVTAFSIAAEIGDFSRFPNARSFMSYLGLVPSENSTGESVARGKITRTGNGHVRTLLVEAAWHTARTYSPANETAFADMQGASARTARIAAEANRRLHARYLHLRSRGKKANVVDTAIAREMSGFVWALAACEE